MTKQVRRDQPLNRAARKATANNNRDRTAIWPTSAETAGRKQRWSTTHTWEQPDWTIDELIAAKDGRTVSVVLPALNEEETVADVIASIRPLVGTLVDELIVLDSGSTDATAERATAAGAQVVSREEAVPELEPVKGKGEVLWRSIAVATGDIIAFVDSDLIDPDPMFVPKMLGPLLVNPDIQLVKGYYRRPLRTGDTQDANGGGRVTELVARPLLASQKPDLTAVLQPLGGEYAGTRELLSSVPFAPGYGVEIGLLIDTYDRYGLEGIGQVNLGVRTHRNRPLIELGVMSRQIVGTLMRRCGLSDSGVGLTQFTAEPDGSFTPHTTEVYLEDRPAMNTLRSMNDSDAEMAS
ncbi:glucosyl-3-phosphoglycerate synthase [Gordonia sp. ABSL1-1]|uniref:glucosyl-3-phosphoglycerate synthase n=1 Tax=Gordonia sp. ABSL1-1 TaxID=3053923 RepID=UPI002573C6FA|nr:glucosyl-3-phosphoglycerate synthase [Gordonia sp. ABSL1-1]MDL9935665.1 glucosyl-3-phosphoglycerate synthase [Gordonia sp. ABSL1-1]